MSKLFITNDKVGIKPVTKPFFKSFKTILHKLIPTSNNKKGYSKPSKATPPLTNKVDLGMVSVDDWQEKMIAHWKLLEHSSTEGVGNLYLYVPSEEAEGFRHLIEQYQIEAIVHATTIAA